jgi:hypothetical protein
MSEKKPSERWERKGSGRMTLEVGLLSASVFQRLDSMWGHETGAQEYPAGDHGVCDTLESAQLAAEAWLRERAREILEVVGEEQR